MPADTWAARRAAEMWRCGCGRGGHRLYCAVNVIERAICEAVEECARICDEYGDQESPGIAIRALLEPTETP